MDFLILSVATIVDDDNDNDDPLCLHIYIAIVGLASTREALFQDETSYYLVT